MGELKGGGLRPNDAEDGSKDVALTTLMRGAPHRRSGLTLMSNSSVTASLVTDDY
jgi:hypothetical protein